MKQLQYGSDAAPLRFEYPSDWDGSLVTAISLTVYDRDGDVLAAADDLTLYTATTLNGAVERYADEIILAAGAGDLADGDSLKIVGIGGSETVRVKGWDTSTKTATIDGYIHNEYDDAEDVYGLWGTYELDVSDTDVFTKGIVLRLVWTPTGSGGAVTTEVQVSASSLDVAGLRSDFRDMYPRAYAAYTEPVDKFDRMRAIAERQMTSELDSKNIDIQRIVDQETVSDALLAKMALIWTLNGDVDIEDEAKRIAGEYGRATAVLQKKVEWLDENQDGIEDEEEVASHETFFNLKEW